MLLLTAFPTRPRRRGPATVLVPALSVTVLSCLALSVPAGAAPTPDAVQQSAAAATRPGPVGSAIVLASNKQLSGYDAATDASGRSYIGWIANASSVASRTVYLCTLPPGASACQGGIQSTPSLGIDSATGVKVLVPSNGHVTLVWFHDTSPGSINGPEGAQVATASAIAGGPLSAAVDQAAAPSFGSLLDARLAPNGELWTVAANSDTTKLEVRRGITAAATTLTPPYSVGSGQLGFSGSTAVLAIQRAGYISSPVGYTYFTGSWHGFTNVAHTWTAGANIGVASTTSGIRLLASVDNANYWPVVSRWTGSSFAPRTLTGDQNSCSPSTHDPVADASGRMADVSEECGQVAVANFADTTHASVVRFSSQGTFAQGIPQITTTPRGRAWVVWSTQNSTGTSNALRVIAVQLPGMTRTVSAHSRYGKITLTGPASCLPSVNVAAWAKAKGKHGWKAGTLVVRLGHTRIRGTLSGASLAPGTTYKLTATSVLRGHGRKHKVKVQLTFRTCPV